MTGSINGLGYKAAATTTAGPGEDAQASSLTAASGAAAASTGSGETLSLTVEFGGGLDLLFSKQPKHQLELPAFVPLPEGSPAGTPPRRADMRFLIHYLAKHLLREREELFREGETVRPGILVLINDTDWELENELEYVLEPRDCITLISTLHGG